MDVFDAFRVSKIKNPYNLDNEYFESKGGHCPLDEESVEVLYPSLEWEEILWGNSSVLLKGETRIEQITSFKYYKKSKDSK